MFDIINLHIVRRNALIKKIIRKFKSFCKKIKYLFPLKNIIMFESYPSLTDNTNLVFEEMLRRNLNKKYKFIWRVEDNFNSKINIENVFFYRGRKDKKKVDYCLANAKVLISCNYFLVPYSPKQFSFYLSHGTPIKRIKDYYGIPEEISHCLVAGKGIKEMACDQFKFPTKNAVALGFPRNDELTTSPANVRKLLETTCNKVIIWYPTFRQHCTLKTGSKHAIPLMHNKDYAQKINEFAKENNVLIVIKPHPSQDVNYITELNLSNIRFINDKFYADNNVSSYQFVGGCDALITDYSSIYYDFTLCDKPIAVIWEDIEDYKTKPGLIDDYEFYLKGAEKVYTTDDFCGFIERVATNQDVLAKERREIRDLANISCDGQNSKRVVDFILSKIEKNKRKTKNK